MKICIDPGHTYGLNGIGGDPGAINKELGIKESVIALEIATTLGQFLKGDGYDILFTRTTGRADLTLKKRCEIANRNKCDLFLSIHLNSFSDSSAHGIETLVYSTKGGKAYQYAWCILHEMILQTSAKDRGVKERKDLYVLKHTVMPAVLIETGFISNKAEGLKLNDPQYQRLLCEGIRKGIIDAKMSEGKLPYAS